jgi:hypothetical protein
MTVTGKRPVAVHYAVGICGLFAAVLIVGTLATIANGNRYSAMSVVIGLIYAGLGWGLGRASRIAQVLTIVVGGVLALLLALAAIVGGGALMLVFAVVVALPAVLVTIPASAREYFAHGGRSTTARA